MRKVYSINRILFLRILKQLQKQKSPKLVEVVTRGLLYLSTQQESSQRADYYISSQRIVLNKFRNTGRS